MTATYDGTDTIKIYENGTEIGSVDGMGGPGPRNDTDTNIGGWTNNTSETLDGMLYEVAIFASVLEVEDIEALMEEGLVTLLPVEPAGKLTTTWQVSKLDDRLSKTSAAGTFLEQPAALIFGRLL